MKNTKHITVIGRNGFIGSALSKYLVKNEFEVNSFPTKETSILFHFGSPVHPPFEKNPDYHINEILSSFMYLLPFCRENGIYFVYASSALVYEESTLMFAKAKRLIEQYAGMYPNTLGLRIFPVYGPGENRTAIAQWCDAMARGQHPVVYGDGQQKRDFIYIDDVIEQISTLVFSDEAVGTRDVGAGNPVSFNSIIDTINEVLRSHLMPKYIPEPLNYANGIVCQNPGRTEVPLVEGIRRMLHGKI